jgi:hypothetical protein
MSPRLLDAYASYPCSFCGSDKLTIARDREVRPHFEQGEVDARGVEVLTVTTTVTCDACRELLYRAIDHGRGRLEVVRRSPTARAQREVGRFLLLEVD